jgi:hypothetical protein
MSNIAILLVGELRFENESHFLNFQSKLKNYNIFISTYPKYERIAKLLTDNYIISDITLPDKYMPYKHIYQWFHLNNILTIYKNVFYQNFENLIKLRTDININSYKFSALEVNKNTTYVQTDQIFYANTFHFINTFQNFYSDIFNFYWEIQEKKYINLNYLNLYKSEFPIDIRTEWLTLPKLIYDKNQLILKKNIKNNLDTLLSEDTHLIKNMDMIIGMKIEPHGLPFSSEKCFAINCINSGLIAQSKIIGNLDINRRNFNFL